MKSATLGVTITVKDGWVVLGFFGFMGKFSFFKSIIVLHTHTHTHDLFAKV